MISKLNKKASHVGIVISFVMFATFVFFFYLIVQPALTSENRKSLTDSLKGQMTYLLSADLTGVSMTVSPAVCVNLTSFISQTEIGNKAIVRNDTEKLNSKINNNDLYITTNSNTFLHVYGSDEFPQSGTGPISGCSPGYNLGLVKKTSEIFETKIIGLFANYSTNYTNTKNQLKIPVENEFSMDFIYANGTNISAQNPQAILPVSSTNIYIDEIPIQYISADAERKAGKLRIKIW